MVFTFLSSTFVHAEVKSLNELYAKAMADKTQTIGSLSKDVSYVPQEELVDGKKVMKVTRVAQGSKLEQLGLKVGDYVELQHKQLPPGMEGSRPLKSFPGLIKTH